jgi:hypothetical protein
MLQKLFKMSTCEMPIWAWCVTVHYTAVHSVDVVGDIVKVRCLIGPSFCNITFLAVTKIRDIQVIRGRHRKRDSIDTGVLKGWTHWGQKRWKERKVTRSYATYILGTLYYTTPFKFWPTHHGSLFCCAHVHKYWYYFWLI